MFIFLITMCAEQNEIGDESYTQGRRQDLDSFIISCMWWFQCSALLLSRQRFFIIIIFLYVCRACLLLVRIKLFCLKFFKGLSSLFLVKLVDYSQFFYFLFLALLSPIGNFCCWANITLGLYFFFFFFLEFRFIKIFIDFKRRKILDLQIFLQIFVVISGY